MEKQKGKFRNISDGKFIVKRLTLKQALEIYESVFDHELAGDTPKEKHTTAIETRWICETEWDLALKIAEGWCFNSLKERKSFVMKMRRMAQAVLRNKEK